MTPAKPLVPRHSHMGVNADMSTYNYGAYVTDADAAKLEAVAEAAKEVCSHRDIEKVVLDASLMDDIKALAAAVARLEGK